MAKVRIGTIRRIAKETDPTIRMTKNALKKLQDVATDFIRVTIVDSINLTKHRNRKTVDEKDVTFATA